MHLCEFFINSKGDYFSETIFSLWQNKQSIQHPCESVLLYVGAVFLSESFVYGQFTGYNKKYRKSVEKNIQIWYNEVNKICAVYLYRTGAVALKKYFSEYIASVIAALENDSTDFAALKDEMLTKIAFMQHERLIHLLVTILFALTMFLCLIGFFVSDNIGVLAAAALMLVLLVPYIAHYYFLENGVQKLYSLYDEVCGRIVD